MTTDDHNTPLRFKSGLRFGLGFSIPFLILFVVAGTLVALCYRIIQEDLINRVRGDLFGPHVGLTITHHERDQAREALVVRGQVENKGSVAWKYIRLQVDLTNADGRFVGLCEDSVNGILYPNRERYFVVKCGDWVPQTDVANLEYSIEIVGASRAR